jgi:hypothetical protein
MFEVTIRIAHDSAVLSERMGAMRTWLDERRFEPAAFRHTFGHDTIVCCVDFTVETEAEAFAAAFDGKVTSRSPEAV